MTVRLILLREVVWRLIRVRIRLCLCNILRVFLRRRMLLVVVMLVALRVSLWRRLVILTDVLLCRLVFLLFMVWVVRRRLV